MALYLHKTVPDLLREYLNSLGNHNTIKSEYYLNAIKQHQDSFKNWLNANDTASAMKAINALKIKKGEFIRKKDEIILNEIKSVSYYKAIIINQDGKQVGEFSPVTYYSQEVNIVIYNRATKYLLIIPNKYSFLKIIMNFDDKYKLTFCGQNGYEYKNSEHYKSQIIRHEYNVPDAYKILSNMIYINKNSISDISEITALKDKIFSIRKLGQGDVSALSIYDNDMKIAELLANEGFFTQVEGQSKAVFTFNDVFKNLHVKNENDVYLTVIKEKNKYKTLFVEGRPVRSDAHFNQAHLHQNELLEPNINVIYNGVLDDVLLKDTQVLSHKNSKTAQYSKEQKKNGRIVKRFALLDNKGSDNTDDDVYQANLENKGTLIHLFNNLGFYISEEIPNESESIFFIHDFGKNIRHQLPKKINSLKLARIKGRYKLVPYDQYDSVVENIPDEYKYIDSIFAHNYEKIDYSHKHVNSGPIDFDKYKLGTIFTIKYDPNDRNICKRSDGMIIKLDNTPYLTKVKLFNGNVEIGMLSNNYSHFKGKIFFSADYNYSYTDFLASISPQVINEDNKIRFDESDGDLGRTNSGYTDYQRFNTQQEQTASLSNINVEKFTKNHSSQEAIVNYYLAHADDKTKVENQQLVLTILNGLNGNITENYNYLKKLHSEKNRWKNVL